MTDTDTTATSDEAAEAFEPTHKLWMRVVNSTDTTTGPGGVQIVHRRERTVTLDDRQAEDLTLHHLRDLIARCDEIGLDNFATVKVSLDPLGYTVNVAAREVQTFADGDQ